MPYPTMLPITCPKSAFSLKEVANTPPGHPPVSAYQRAKPKASSVFPIPPKPVSSTQGCLSCRSARSMHRMS